MAMPYLLRTCLTRRALRAFALAWAALFAGAALADAPARPSTPAQAQSEVDLWPAVTLLSDPAGTLDVHAVLARLPEFRRPQVPHANLGVRRDAVWLHVPLQVPKDGSARWVLEIDYAPLDRIDMHLLTDGVPVRHHVLGKELPFAQRPLPSAPHAVVLELAAGGEHELLLRVRSSSSVIVPLRLLDDESFQAREARLQMLQGLLAGIGLCLTVYSVVHALMLRSPMFAHYALAVASTTLFFFAFHGLAAQHLWPDQRWLSSNAAPLLVLLAIVGGLCFIGHALHVREMSSRLHAAQTVVWVAALAVALAFVAGLVDYRVAQSASTLLGVACMLATLPATLMRARGGDRAAWIVAVGWTAFAVGAFTMALLLRGVLPFDAWTQHAFQAGSAVEMLSWLVVLGLRMEEVRRSARKVHAERDVMRSLAETDALTGLPNRRGLRQRLDACLPQCGPHRMVALYMADLDGFKAVNDRLGHDAGDLLLKAVAQRLRTLLRSGDTVARLGGDEFVVCAVELPGREEAQRLGRKLVEGFHAPFEIQGQRCEVGLTVGYVLAPLNGRDADALLKLADAALYAGKAAGKGRVLGAHDMRADTEGFSESALSAAGASTSV